MLVCVLSSTAEQVPRLPFLRERRDQLQVALRVAVEHDIAEGL
jgi:hypothetical protein